MAAWSAALSSLILTPRASQLPDPVITASATAYSSAYAATNMFGPDPVWPPYEYVSKSQGVGAGMFIDFDFGASKPISGFDFWNRPVDAATAFDLIFSDTPDFSVAITTRSFTASADGNQAASATFEPVTARYLRLQATANAGGENTGVNEIQF